MPWNALDRFIGRIRYGKATKIIRKLNNPVVVDVGCGTDGAFLRSISPYISKGYGFDKYADNKNEDSIVLSRVENIENGLPLPDNSADCVVMLAVIEHLSNPAAVLSDVFRISRPGAVMIATVPTWTAKPILELLAYKLKVISADEIADHKRYYNKRELRELLDSVFGAGAGEIKHFEFGWNLFAKVNVRKAN